MNPTRRLLPLLACLSLSALGCGGSLSKNEGDPADAGSNPATDGTLPLGASCSVTSECAGETVCSQGLCAQPCVVGSCGADLVCQSDGRCLPLAQVVGSTDGGCGEETYSATGVEPNLQVLLDRSTSMADKIGDKSMWSIALTALRATLDANAEKIRFGIEMFPYGAQCTAGNVLVPVGENGTETIMSQLPTSDPTQSYGTPITKALNVALNALASDPDADGKYTPKDATRSNNVLLITDGEENCGGDPVAKAAQLYEAGIRTYVLGFGSGVDGTMLSSVATAGGTARSTSPKYYVADNEQQLIAALDEIARGSLGCDYALGKTPPDPRRIYVLNHGIEVPRDTLHVNGWDYLAESNRLVFYGSACTRITEDSGASLRVVFGCRIYGPN